MDAPYAALDVYYRHVDHLTVLPLPNSTTKLSNQLSAKLLASVLSPPTSAMRNETVIRTH